MIKDESLKKHDGRKLLIRSSEETRESYLGETCGGSLRVSGVGRTCLKFNA